MMQSQFDALFLDLGASFSQSGQSVMGKWCSYFEAGGTHPLPASSLERQVQQAATPSHSSTLFEPLG
jgi:hypothetical protein